MEEAKGEVKNVVLVKFKEGTSEEQIDQLIKAYANMVNLVDPMMSFHWEKDLSIENQQEGYTHMFETIYESVEGFAEYKVHPAHIESTKLWLPNLEQLCTSSTAGGPVITKKSAAEIQAFLTELMSKLKDQPA